MTTLLRQRQLRLHRRPAVGLRRHGRGAHPGPAVPGGSGLNYSIEFTGGTLVQIETTAAVDVGADPDRRSTAQGITGAEIQQFGGPREYVIRARVAKRAPTPTTPRERPQAVTAALDASARRRASTRSGRTEAVGPKVGGELRQKALLAILLSFVAVLAYLAYPVRVALRPRGGHRDGARHPGHARRSSR